MASTIAPRRISINKYLRFLIAPAIMAALAGCHHSKSAAPTYPIGGTVSGLTTSGLVLANGVETVSVPANATSFGFLTPQLSGQVYTVVVQTQPTGQTCQVADGDGTFGTTAVTNVAVTCIGPWTWRSGADTSGAAGVYGTLGTAAAANVPGARDSAVNWTDSSGNFWLFGGTYTAADGNLYVLNDLWKYDPTSGFWEWVSGSSTPSMTYGTPGIYGTKGVAAAGNTPGSRSGAISWIDSSGNLWLFGGYGYDSTEIGYLNDLWKFVPSTGQWTWVSGPANAAAVPSAVYGTAGTAAAGNLPGPRSGASAWIDSSGDLWLFGGYGDISNASPYQFGDLNDLWKFSPTSGDWTWVNGTSTVNASGVYGTLGTGAAANVPPSRQAAAYWLDSSGNFWLFGGNSPAGYLDDLWEYVPGTNEWAFVTGGTAANLVGNYGSLGNASSVTVPGGRAQAAFWVDSTGNFWLFGGNGSTAPATSGLFNDLWQFNPTAKQWTWISGSSSGGAAGVYGTLGTAAAGNVPGARAGAASWIDGTGNLWLFGGQGSVSPLAGAELNDLWEYAR